MQKKSMLDLHRISAEEFKQAEKIPVAVVLDDVRSEMNVGSVFRTADAFVVEQIALCGITSTPPVTKFTRQLSAPRIRWRGPITILHSKQSNNCENKATPSAPSSRCTVASALSNSPSNRGKNMPSSSATR